QDTITAGPNHNFQDINLLGQDASYVGALAVDPNNPNVVYVGGSTQWAANPGLAHALVRVDTGDMRDADPSHYGANPPGVIPNDGDDIQKVAAGAAGEGVYWYDIVQRAASQS